MPDPTVDDNLDHLQSQDRAPYWTRVRSLTRNKQLIRLLEKSFIINAVSTKYASVSIYPGENYSPFIEIGKIGGNYLTLSSKTWHILVDYFKERKISDEIADGITMTVLDDFCKPYLRLTSMNVSIKLSFEEIDNLCNINRCLSILLAKYEESQQLIETFCKSFKSNAIPSNVSPNSSFLFTMLAEELKMYPELRKL